MDSPIENQLEILAEWDVDALLECLGITTEELLEVPEFKARAIEWIEENT